MTLKQINFKIRLTLIEQQHAKEMSELCLANGENKLAQVYINQKIVWDSQLTRLNQDKLNLTINSN